MSAILYDHRGNPIASQEIRELAENLLKEYVVKHQSRFQDWINAHGTKRPPIFFDVDRKEWVWVAN